MSVSDRVLQYRRWIIVAFHAGMIIFGYWLAYLLRFEFPLSSEDQQQFVRTLPLILIARLAIFAWYHLYEGLWRYVSMHDMRIAECGMRNAECGMTENRLASWKA